MNRLVLWVVEQWQLDDGECCSFSIKLSCLWRRDLSNGFIYAEILSRYFPADIHMHSFENVTCTELKKANWHVLSKFFKVGWG